MLYYPDKGGGQNGLIYSKRNLRYIYKYKDAEIGKLLYEEYAAKIICSEQDFVERLKFLESEKVK